MSRPSRKVKITMEAPVGWNCPLCTVPLPAGETAYILKRGFVHKVAQMPFGPFFDREDDIIFLEEPKVRIDVDHRPFFPNGESYYFEALKTDGGLRLSPTKEAREVLTDSREAHRNRLLTSMLQFESKDLWLVDATEISLPDDIKSAVIVSRPGDSELYVYKRKTLDNLAEDVISGKQPIFIGLKSL